jgi:colanic acid/amylovoran biosynthesis glycosyltransferase
MSTVAIIAPKIGAQSETFIKRHMDDLAPGQTVVLAKTDKLPNAGHWQSLSPSYVLKRYPPNPWPLIQTYMSQLAGKKRLNAFSFHRRYAIEHFLKRNHVSIMFGEYLDYTHAYIDLAESLGIPLWAHAHGYDISKQLLDETWRLNYRDYNRTAGIITVNQISKQRLIELGIDEQKIHIIPCGVDVPPTIPQRENRSINRPVRCLAVGRMVRKKGPILLLHAFRQAIQEFPHLHLDIVGTGELINEAISFIDKHHLASNITLHGGQNHDRVKEFMATADIFLQHSIVDPETGDEEGMPVAILEAMAHGLPVISTRHAGIPEAVLEEQTGLLVHEGDTESMAEHIVKLAKDVDTRLALGLAGWQRAVECFSWQRERTDLLKLLELTR